MKYNRYPLDYVAITDPYGSTDGRVHYGLDLGWSSVSGGMYPSILAINDGVVVDERFDSAAGNYIAIETIGDGYKWIHKYLHMNERSLYKVGDTVTRGTAIGVMGSTGSSTGNHLHLELWKCPIDYVYRPYDRLRYGVDPTQYVFLFDDQGMSSDSVTSSKVFRVVGSSLIVDRDTSKNQIFVKNKYLRCRKEPNGEILGYIDLGIYNYYDVTLKGDYSWYKIGDNKWIANTDDIEVYKVEPIIDPPIDPPNPDEPIDNKYKLFKAPKEGIYYINMKKNETLYYEK